MVSADDLSPSAARVANLALVLGIGTFGEEVVSELTTLLEASGDAHRQAVVCWGRAGQGVDGAAEAARKLLSNQNLDALERAGYQIPGRGIGQPPRLSLVYIVEADAENAGTLQLTAEALKAVSTTALHTIIPIGRGDITEIVDSEVVCNQTWNLILPVSTQDRVAGLRSRNDIVATVARTVFVFSLANQAHFAAQALGGASASAAIGSPVVKIGTAFLDSGHDELVHALSKSIAAGLLDRQFENPRSFQPALSFDDQRRTKLLELVRPNVILHRLLADTPFGIRTENGEAWVVQLPVGIVAAEVQRLPKRRWIAVLQKLRDFFDFTKARQWADSIEHSEVALADSLEEAFSGDIRQLHHYERGPDRLMAWATGAREILETQPEITRPGNTDFDEAVRKLRKEIMNSPNPLSIWVCVALLGWIGAEGVRYIIGGLSGYTVGWLAFAMTLGGAALLGMRVLEQAHRALHSARLAAQDALIRRYEAQTRENLVVSFNRIRNRFIARLEEELGNIQSHAERATSLADELATQSVTGQDSDVVNVEYVIPLQLRRHFLESLNVPWATLQRQAAAEGAFVPNPEEGEDSMTETAAALTEFAKRFLASRVDDFGFEGLLDFRAQETSNSQRESLATLIAVRQ